MTMSHNNLEFQVEWHDYLTFITKRLNMKKIFLSVFAALASFIALAQEKSAEIDVNVNKGGGGNWYTAPWVWVVGIAVFILLLVALLRGGGRSRSDA